MQILPPRRPGNFGAFIAGPGAPGPTGQFKIQSGAAPSRQPSPQDLPAPKGSVAKPAPLSVSEQMEAQRKAAARAAAQVVVPPGQADVYGRPAQVTVQSYAPPQHTPEVTQPPQQPNAQHAVSVQARQIPQTPQQVIQKTLAKDAGIATSLPPGQPPLRLPAPTPQVSKLTTRPEADNIQLKPLVSPPVSRESYAQSLATGAKVVGAKVAQQRAASAERQAASATKSFKRATDKAASAHTFAKDAAQQAKDAAEKAKALQVELARIQKNQTASEDEKSKAEAAARSAQEEAARTAKAAADAKAKAEAASAEQAKLAAEAQRAVAVAEQTATVADEKIKDASVAQKAEAKIETAVAEQPKMLPPPSGAPAVSGEASAAAPAEKPTVITGEGQAATAAPEGAMPEKPASGSKVMPILVLGGLAVLAYAAMRKKGSSLNAAPTLIEDLD